MENEQKSLTRRARLGRHVRGNLVGYVALFIAVSMTPLPSYAASVAVGTAGIKNGAVTTPKLAANAVTSAKVKNGTIRKLDIAPGSRGYIAVRSRTVTNAGVTAGSSSSRTVYCNAGEVAIGGGAYVTPAGDFNLPGTTSGDLTKSYPASKFVLSGVTWNVPSSNGGTPIGWRTDVTNTTGGTEDAIHYAVCAAK